MRISDVSSDVGSSDLNTPEGDENEPQASSEKLKHQLDNFGAINPMAMEAFDEMNERFQFSSKEKNDLVEAKVALLNTIGEIDETARNQFLEAFALIGRAPCRDRGCQYV